MSDVPETQTADEAVDQAPAQVETLQVESLDQFVRLLVAWHDTKCRLLKHMSGIPADAVVEINGVDHTFTPEMRQGFELGLTVALSELGQLPFAVETDEEPPAANDSEVN